jgi:hypothetical protein
MPTSTRSGAHYLTGGNRFKIGECNMKAKIISGVAAVALTLSTAAAFAQTSIGQQNQGSASAQKTPGPQGVVGQYDMGGASAQKTPGPQGVVGQYDMGGATAQKGPIGQYDQGSASSKKTNN